MSFSKQEGSTAVGLCQGKAVHMAREPSSLVTCASILGAFFFLNTNQAIDKPVASRLFTGIFAYMNYRVPRTRKEIFETLIKGLQRLEYRGYDSAGRSCGHRMQGRMFVSLDN